MGIGRRPLRPEAGERDPCNARETRAAKPVPGATHGVLSRVGGDSLSIGEAMSHSWCLRCWNGG